MAEYIEREAALEAIQNLYPGIPFTKRLMHRWHEENRNFMQCESAIERLPAADVQPVRHGRWIWDEDGMDWNIGAWRCSECKVMSPMWWNADKTSPMHKSGHRYCPNCGAKMDLEG